MPPAGDIVEDDAVWVPVTINLPLGLTKAFTPDNCAPISLLVGPFSVIMLAQTANTVLVPVLPLPPSVPVAPEDAFHVAPEAVGLLLAVRPPLLPSPSGADGTLLLWLSVCAVCAVQ